VSRLPPNDSARPARDHETPRKTDPHSPYSSPALTIARGSLALTRSSKAAGHQTCESLAVRYVAGQCTQNPRKEEHVRLHKTRLPRGGKAQTRTQQTKHGSTRERHDFMRNLGKVPRQADGSVSAPASACARHQDLLSRLPWFALPGLAWPPVRLH